MLGYVVPFVLHAQALTCPISCTISYVVTIVKIVSGAGGRTEDEKTIQGLKVAEVVYAFVIYAKIIRDIPYTTRM